MELVDTHCHIQTTDYPLLIPEVEERAVQAGVTRLICVGCTAEDSELAVQFVQNRPNAWASIGLHPHEAKDGEAALAKLRQLLINADYRHPSGDLTHPPLAPTEEHSTKDKVLSARYITLASSSFHSLRGTSSLSESTSSLVELPQDSKLPAKPEGPNSSNAHSFIETQNSEAPAVARSTNTDSPFPGERSELLASRSGSVEASGRQLGYSQRDETESSNRKVVAIGECGLDYFYGHSSKQDQEKALRYQIELALEHNLPLIFHVRDAFDDFWPVFNDYQGIRGVMHSFTDSRKHMDKILENGLFIGVNGITTFTKNDWQLENAKAIPLQNLLLETDAPFLTPKPLRGKVNEPAHILFVAQFLADLKGISVQEIARATTQNARQLFSLN